MFGSVEVDLPHAIGVQPGCEMACQFVIGKQEEQPLVSLRASDSSSILGQSALKLDVATVNDDEYVPLCAVPHHGFVENGLW